MRAIKLYQPIVFFGSWVLATVFGTELGIEVAFRLYFVIEPFAIDVFYPFPLEQSQQLTAVFYPVVTASAVGMCIGFASGLLQALLLNWFFSVKRWRWVVANTIGWTLGLCMKRVVLDYSDWPMGNDSDNWIVLSLLAGLILGACQTYAAREHFPKFSWWMAIQTLLGGFLIYHLIVLPRPLNLVVIYASFFKQLVQVSS